MAYLWLSFINDVYNSYTFIGRSRCFVFDLPLKVRSSLNVKTKAQDTPLSLCMCLALLYPLVGFQQGGYSACEVSYIYRNRKIFRWDFPHFATNPMEKFEYPYFLRNFAKRKNTIC